MKEVDVFIKTIAEGLKTLSQGIEKIADKIDDFAQAQKGVKAKSSPKRPAPKPAATPKKASRQKAPQNPASSKQTAGIDTVYQHLPETLRCVAVAGKSATHSDYGDLFIMVGCSTRIRG